MEKRGRLRYLVPVLAIALVLIMQPSLPQANLPISFERRAGDYSFRDLTHLLPDGVDGIAAAAPTDAGLALIAHSHSGALVLTMYNAAQKKLVGNLSPLPTHYRAVDSLARSGQDLLFGGSSLGTSPYLGLYESSSSQILDVSAALPSDVKQTSLIVGNGASYLLIMSTDDGLIIPGVFESALRSLRTLQVGEFANVTEVSHGVWNGTSFYVAGEKFSGAPALLSVTPGGEIVDLSSGLPTDMEQIDHLIWAQDALYILGSESQFPVTRASIAVHNPSAAATTSLSGALRSDYSRLPTGVWNGTALILLAEGIGFETLMAYHPSNDTSLYVDDVLPPNWDYQSMVQAGGPIVMSGSNGSPFIGQLRTNDWSWEENEGVFEARYRSLHHALAAGESFIIGGSRQSSAALGLIDTLSLTLEDRSDSLNLVDTVIYGTAGDEDWLLIAGANETRGVLYAYEANGTLQDLTPDVPAEVEVLYSPSQIGSICAIPGYGGGKSFLLVYDSASGGITNLAPQVQRYFDSPIRVTAGVDSFLMLGENDLGPALAVLDAATLNTTFLGREFGVTYGPLSSLLDAASDGETFLLGGTIEGRPLLGLWTPDSSSFEDLSIEIPVDFGMITAVAATESGFVLGGLGQEGTSLGVYYPHNNTFAHLRGLVPSSYEAIYDLANLGDDVLLVATQASGDPSVGILGLGDGPVTLADLPAIISEPAGAIVLGLSVALAAAVAYTLGRRRRPPIVQRAQPPPTYPEIPVGPPEEYPPGYPDEYQNTPHWYDW